MKGDRVLRGCPSIFSTTRLGGQIFAARFGIVRSIRIVRARPEPGLLLRAYNDRLIVRNWERIKRAELMSKVETLRFVT